MNQLEAIAHTYVENIVNRNNRPSKAECLNRVHEVLGVGNGLMSFAEQLKGDKTLTEKGKQLKVADRVQKQLMSDFAKVSRPGRKAMAHFAAQKASLGLPPINRSDMVGEMRRREIREYLRTLPEAERAFAARDPAISEAVFDGVPGLSGFKPSHFEAMKADRIKELHGPKLEELSALEDDYTAVVGMAGAVREELFKASGLTRQGFEDVMKPLEAAADAD